MIIFFYKGFTRNPKIRNIPVWVFPNIWRLGQDKCTKCLTHVSNEMLLNAAKCQGYTFYYFWVTKEEPIVEGVSVTFHQACGHNFSLQHKHLDSTKSSLKFWYSRKQSKYLYLIPHVSHFLSLCPNLHLILWISSKWLLTRFDNELPIGLALSTNLSYKGYVFFGIFS